MSTKYRNIWSDLKFKMERYRDGFQLLFNLLVEENHKKHGAICIDLSLTSACNHKCYFCCSHSWFRENHPRPNTLPDEVLDMLFEDMVDLQVKQVILSGDGEQLMIPKVWTYIQQYCDKIQFKILTNGTSLKKIDHSIFMKLKKITVSINSIDNKMHQYIHGYSPNIEKSQLPEVLENIDRLLAMPGTRDKMQINYVLTKDNMNEFPRLIDLITSWGIYCAIRPVSVEADDTKMKEVELSEEDRKNIREECHRRLAQSDMSPQVYRTLKETLDACDRSTILNSQCNGNKDLRACYMGYYWNYICSNGDFQQCTYSSVALGNIRETRLRDLWRQDKIQSHLLSATFMGETGKPLYPACQKCGEPYAHSGHFDRIFRKLPFAKTIIQKKLDSASKEKVVLHK